MHPNEKMAGRAITMQYLPKREDLAESLKLKERGFGNNVGARNTKPGDVLMIDACGFADGGVFGDVLVAGFKANGGEGIVVDGAMRDLSALREMDVPIYYKHLHAAGSRSVMVTAFDVPIDCCGVTVVPGDIIFGDAEGVIVIPNHLAETVTAEAMSL